MIATQECEEILSIQEYYFVNSDLSIDKIWSKHRSRVKRNTVRSIGKLFSFFLFLIPIYEVLYKAQERKLVDS